MLKSSELRIGNWVYLPSKGRNYQILSGHDIEEIEDSGDAEPITLTTEWLSRFGFENTYECQDNELMSTFEWVKISKKKLVKGEYWAYPRQYPGVWTAIEYVHQLQNLYFSLTGDELELVTTPQHS